jgi:hypothetical protein
MKWESYRQSNEWKELKRLALARSGYRCQCGDDHESTRCGNTTLLEMHHDRYPRFQESDSIENVRILCLGCHETFHVHYSGCDLGQISVSDMRYRAAMVSRVCNHPVRMTTIEICDFIKNTRGLQ